MTYVHISIGVRLINSFSVNGLMFSMGDQLCLLLQTCWEICICQMQAPFQCQPCGSSQQSVQEFISHVFSHHSGPQKQLPVNEVALSRLVQLSSVDQQVTVMRTIVVDCITGIGSPFKNHLFNQEGASSSICHNAIKKLLAAS